MMPLRLLLLPLLVVLCCQHLSSQSDLHIKRATDKIIIDGILDETDWQMADATGQFHQYFPADTSMAVAQSIVRMTYDDNFVYVGAIMYNPDVPHHNSNQQLRQQQKQRKGQYRGGRTYVTPSLRRDYRGEANDGITVVFDPFQDNTNAFQFGVNPFGVQREGLIANGGNSSADLSLNWDNKWYSEAYIGEGYWSVEMAIPFKTLRFPEGSQAWNINFYRIDSEYTERSTWAPIPRNFSLISLAFMKKLVWDAPLRKPGANVSIIPYAAGGYSENFTDNTPAKIDRSIGGDAKVAITPGLNLDLTINPDFSQVEVDEQVTNLDRFEIFFPERRQFFLENADLFADFGTGSLRPFFSRRIGIARDESTGVNIQNTIPAGLRLSGKVNNNLRVGLLSMQGARDEAIGLPSLNYTVATMQQKVFSRSNISAIFVNKQAFLNGADNNFNGRLEDYNRTAGVDYNLASKDGRWNGKFFYHQSFENDQPDDAYAASAQLSFNNLNWSIFATAQSVGDNYNPEVGFARRRGYQRSAATASYRFYPNSNIINNHGPGIDFDVLGNNTYGLTDYDVNLMYRISFQNTSFLNVRLRHEYVYLFSAFDPSGSGGLRLPEDTDYNYTMFIASFHSDQRKTLSFDLTTRAGDYFNGTRFFINGIFNYRFQPYGSVALSVNYNRIRLPAPYNSANLYLIGPRFDFTFSRNLFWTTFVQYNNQIDNLNINSRVQWRFKPVSDLFLVYTDNYFPETFTTKSRALVLKLTYWLNV
ncbi:MAG TPA: DUF5916 domain-containing protein [Saprospiraceae bacterium]|nr:DUF5916 domain-containing protein [Saprospiraceae bacterium]HMP24596.1 DUF5916 domain-containing protein [Saprospiraceae bacterium]